MDDRNRGVDHDLDPGAYIGNEPELEAEAIPGGVTRGDERVAAYQSRPGVPGEPDERPEPSSPDEEGLNR
jgi:hypothetical protein